MENTNDVQGVETPDAGTTAESTSSIDKQVDSQGTESDTSNVSEDVTTQNEEESTNADEPKSEKAVNRFQELANKNKDLEAKLVELQQPKPELAKAETQISSWLTDYEKNPFIEMYGRNAKDIPEYRLAAIEAKQNLSEIKNEISSSKNKFDATYNEVMSLQSKSSILKDDSPEYSEDYRDEFQRLVFEQNVLPKEALKRVEKLYNSALSKAQTQGKSNSLLKQNLSSNGKSVTTPSVNVSKMSVSEHRQYLIDHPEFAAQ